MLLTQGRSQSVLRACDEQKRGRRQQDCGEQRPIRNWHESKHDVEPCSDCSEQQHEASILHPERTPDVADESENKGQVEGNGGEQAEIRNLVRLQMQLVLEKKCYG